MRLKTPLAAAAIAALILTAPPARSASTTQPSKGTAVLTGHITDPAGKPAANVVVSLSGKAKRAADAPATQPNRKNKAATVQGPAATTDANGDFKIEGVAAGQYTVTANMRNVGKAYASVTIADGQTVDVKMQISKKAKKTPAS